MAKKVLFLTLLIVGILACGIWGAAYGQKPAEEARPFSLIVLPDTQLYTCTYPEIYYEQTRWIKENAEKENIVFVSHVGDIVQNGAAEPAEWDVANKAMSALDGVVPWAVAIGNHDYETPGNPEGVATTYIKFFGPDRFKDYPWYGGSSPDNLSSYQFFSGGGRKFMIIHLESDTRDETLAWAEAVLKEHPDVPAIVSLHIYLNNGGRRPTHYFRRSACASPEDIWNKLIKKHPQIFMVLCGHVGAEYHQLSTNDAGEKVFELLTDYQHLANGGNGWLRIIRFVPEEDEIQVKTYSPTLKSYKTGPLCDFALPFSFATGELKEPAPAVEAASQ
jgi:hypothetical protein